jgi:hypothetical protein
MENLHHRKRQAEKRKLTPRVVLCDAPGRGQYQEVKND